MFCANTLKKIKKKIHCFLPSFANAFIFFVFKFENNLRLCVNYRKLSTITKKNRYFFSLIEQLFDNLMKIRIFTKLDICFAYNVLRIRKNDKSKIAFRCCYEHYKYKIMFFELINAFANFMNYIHKIFKKYLNIFVIIYVNNIFIFFSK